MIDAGIQSVTTFSNIQTAINHGKIKELQPTSPQKIKEIVFTSANSNNFRKINKDIFKEMKIASKFEKLKNKSQNKKKREFDTLSKPDSLNTTPRHEHIYETKRIIELIDNEDEHKKNEYLGHGSTQYNNGSGSSPRNKFDCNIIDYNISNIHSWHLKNKYIKYKQLNKNQFEQKFEHYRRNFNKEMAKKEKNVQ